MTVTIAAISGKGGSGKTTTVINLACALAGRDKRVLADASSSDAARAYRDLAGEVLERIEGRAQ